MEEFEYLIVGAGPSGLAFASSIRSKETLVVELGKSVSDRNRLDAAECVHGAGGAGLFSDGKFSFYPAGTRIWEQKLGRLRAAYHLLQNDFIEYASIPEFPQITGNKKTIESSSGWLLKPYPSIYLSLEDRIALINKLVMRCPQIRFQTEFLNDELIDGIHHVKLMNQETGNAYTIKAKNIVLAGGRFLPLFSEYSTRFRRYEFGFRIGGPAHLIQKKTELTDPKYIYHIDGVEYRTFCWCENGEIVKTSFKDIETFSGRADCEPTESSNFGFNIRVKNPDLLSESDFREIMRIKPYEESPSEFLKNLSTRYPLSAVKLVEYGLKQLLTQFENLNSEEIRIVGPTIEGVGTYPHVENEFLLENHKSIYVIGDCSGTYRGIVPSMLAGYILAVIENQTIEEHEDLKIIGKLMKATIMNQIECDKEYKKSYPDMKGEGRSIGAAQEIHIFLGDINPTQERVKEYYAVVEKWNQLHPDLTYKMKPCYLGLIFRNPQGGEQTVCVLQSSRYVRTNDSDYAVHQSHCDAAWFVQHGFSVIREKIEVEVHGTDGIPLTDEAMNLYPTKYFEFHIKVGRVDKEDLSELTSIEIDQLKAISNEFTTRFQVPVSLSFNNNRDQHTGDGQGHQRFLNVRFRNIGYNSVEPKLNEVKQAINETGTFKVLKTISEYVWYDSFTALDYGWIDYSPEELNSLMLELAKAG